MSVGIVLVTHGDVGDALLRAAVAALGMCPLRVEVLAVQPTDEPEDMRNKAKSLVEQVSQGDGVIVLTDAYGATPSNIATAVQSLDNTSVVAGLNLPMLLKVFNYSRSSLDELVQKAIEGGRDGILHVQPR